MNGESTTTLEVRVRTGDGLVARNGSLLAVLGAGADTDEVLARIEGFDATRQTSVDLLALVRSLPAGASIAMTLLGAESDLVLRGAVRCEAAGPAGTSAFEGSSAAQLVGLPSPLDHLTLALHAAAAPANPRTTLVDGITPGGGVEITVAGAAAAGAPPLVLPPPPPAVLPPPEPGAPPPTPAPMPVAASAAVVNVLLTPPDDVPVREPLPDTPEAMPEHALRAQVVVRGLACGIGHVNRVDAPYCSACGRRLQGTVNLVSGPRPSLGTLIFDDGSAFGLEHGYVIGRDPAGDPAVRSGVAHALPLDDPERAVSRVHAEIRLDGWDTLIVDRGSANGTHVAVPGGTAWQRLAPDVPVVLADGWSVAIGRRTFVFQQR
jgi:hypothetical protein